MRSRATVADLLEAAAQLFEHEGLGATTNRIAERAGYSIGTLYQYFPDKQALLYALAEQHIDVLHRCLEEVLARLRRQRPGWEDTVRTLTSAVVDLHRDRPRLHELMYTYAPRHPEGVARLEALYESVTGELAAHARRCGRDGGDARHTAAMLVHAADAQLHRVLAGREDAAEELLRTLSAMSPPAGPACSAQG